MRKFQHYFESQQIIDKYTIPVEDDSQRLVDYLKSMDQSEQTINQILNSTKNRDGVLQITPKGKIQFYDDYTILGKRDPSGLNSKKGMKFIIRNLSKQESLNNKKFINNVLQNGMWDSGNLSQIQVSILEDLVKEGLLKKRKGNPDEITANGIPTVYEPV